MSPSIPLFGSERSKPTRKKKSSNTDTVDVLAGAAMKVIDHIKGNTSTQSDKTQSVSIITNVAGISSSPEDLHYGLSPAKKVQIRSQYLTQLRELQKLYI